MNIQINRKTAIAISRNWPRPGRYGVNHNLGPTLINRADRAAIGVAYLVIQIGRTSIEFHRALRDFPRVSVGDRGVW
jgi:hypothetical protein